MFSLCLQNDLRVVDLSRALTNTPRIHRRHVVSGAPRRPRYPSAVAAPSMATYISPFHHRATQTLTSLSAFSLFNASIAAISRIDSSTFPCSPRLPVINQPVPSLNRTRTQRLDLFRPSLNGQFNFSNLPHLYYTLSSRSALRRSLKAIVPYQIRGLCVFFRCLFQTAVCRSNSSITFIHEGEDIRFILHLEAVENGIARVGFSGY